MTAILIAIPWTAWGIPAALIVLLVLLTRLYVNGLVEGQRRLREGIRKKTEELRRETDRAIRSEKIKEEFLANMSHEIRTPMNAVVGLTNLLLERDPRPDQISYLKALLQSADHLLGVINDILDLSRIEAGQLPVHEEVFHLGELMESMKTMLEFRAKGKGIDLEIELDPGLPEYLRGDSTRISQILVNLGGNAVKFTHKGRVQIRALPLSDYTDMGERKDWVRFEVVDTGIGISAERLPHMFESFTQESNAITRQYGGTGLGLAISRRLADLLKGRLYAVSEQGKGSTFTLELPLITAESPIKNKPGDQDQWSFPPGMEILLVEDDAFNQMVAVDTLKNHIPGVQIRIAGNGLQALEMLREKNADLVLMDIQMPVMDGLEAAQLLRKEEELHGRKRTPVLAMTANVLPADLDRCRAAGMDGLVPKPFKIQQLLRQISEFSIE